MSLRRRTFLASSSAAAAVTAGLVPSLAKAMGRQAEEARYDLIVVGAGTAGMPAAIFAARRGAHVLMIDAAADIGGTLHMAFGEVCGAGTKTQARFGVTDDHPDMHFDDVMRMSKGKADPIVVRHTVDNAPRLIDWLDDRGWQCRDSHFLTGESPGRSGYSRKRYYQAQGEGRAIMKVFVNEVSKDIANGSVRSLVNTRVSELLTSDDGTVEGVRANVGGDSFTFRSRHVLLTTGGYGMNPDLFQELVGFPTYLDDCYPATKGDGLIMARAVGAHLRNAHLHRPGSGSVLDENTFPTKVYARFDTRSQMRPPWEIWVNDHGQRYVNEETLENSQREQTLLGQPRLRYSIVFDEEILDTAPVAFADWSRDRVAEHFNNHMMFHKADTLEELAARADLNPNGLAETVAAYNAGLSGSDPLGREHRPLAIAKPPYYAIVQLGHSVTSAVGITINQKLQAVTESGEPIKGLYAAGEVLGSGVSLGNAFVPGMMITPAMTLGKVIGETLPVA